MTFEHYPPQCAFNDIPVFRQGFEQLTSLGGHQFGVKQKSHKGFGGHTLCKSCNNNIGGWYSKSYCSFVEQAMYILFGYGPEDQVPVV